MNELTHPQREVLHLALKMLGNKHLLQWQSVANTLHGVVMASLLFDAESPDLTKVRFAAVGLMIEEMK